MENQQLKMELDVRTKELKYMEECRNRWMDVANEMMRKVNELRDKKIEAMWSEFMVCLDELESKEEKKFWLNKLKEDVLPILKKEIDMCDN